MANAQYIEDQSVSDFLSITTENGLSQNTVNTILKDKSGYLWFGTDEGLNRYNSYDIEVIDINKNKSETLIGKKVLDLYEDDENLLWIATDNGLKLYNPITETITLCNLFENFNKPIKVNCIEKENDSLVWLGTSEGLVLYNLNHGVIDNYRHAANRTNSLSNSEVLSLANDNANLWIGTRHGLNRLNKKSKRIINYFYNENDKNSVGGNIITALTLNKEGNLWIGTLQGGLSYYNKKHFKTFHTDNSLLPHNEVSDIFLTKEGDLWVATNGGGLAKMNKTSHTFSTLNHDPDHIQSLVTNSIYSVYEDREGILWVGTYAGGVCFNTSKNSVFKLIRHQAHDKNSIIESRIRSVFLDSKNNLWFGTWGGISKYNSKNKQYTSYSHEKNNPSSLSFNTVTSIFEDSKSNMWFGTYSGGVNLLTPDKRGFYHYKHNLNDTGSISDNKIYCFAEDASKNLWIGTQTGLNLYDPIQNNFKKYSNINVRDIKVTKNNNLVLATIGGIAIFNPSTETFEDFYSNQLESFPISQVYFENGEELIWFCSQGGGMGYLDLNNHEFTFFTEDDGLPSNFVSSMVSMGDNAFWVSTFKGLVKFDKKTQAFENFGDSYKLPSKQFQPKASVILPDHSIGFGGSKGLVIFHPDSISKSKKGPSIVFSSLKIDNKSANVNVENSPLNKSISKTEQINLKAIQNDFSIDFAALDFNTQGKNKYAYILENYMNDWVNIGANRSVGFTNLNHGDYVLKVKVINSASKSNEKSLKIFIAPPFYATWWFKTMMFLTFILLLYYYNKYTIISTKQKNENELQRMKLKNEEDFNQMRFRFFTYISHELRTPLTLISDPISQLIKYNKDEKNSHLLQLVNKNVFRLLRLVDQILDISKLEGDTLSLQVSEQNIIECIENTTHAFHEFAIQNEITFKFQPQEKSLMGWIDEDKIEKILYNLLSNAFKFTMKRGHITILLDYTDASKEYIIVSVVDDGIGIAEDKLAKIFEGFYQIKSAKSLNPNGAGIGLDYVNRLVILHNGNIKVESELDKGSTFSVTIPIKKEFYESKNIRNYVPERLPLKPINLSKDTPENEIITKNHNKNTPKILVVEDDFDIRSYIVNALSENFRVIEAPHGEKGLVKALKHIPDLILSDTLMPVMDGIEFCKQIKENEKTSHIPFLFLSAWTSDEFKIKGLSLGANDYIKKPFSIQILESRIKNIIETNKKISEKSKTKINFIPDNKDIDSTDDLFIKKAYEVLDQNFDNPEFNAHEFRKKMNMSHSGLYRKLTQLTEKSSNEFIRDYRLKRATQIIKQNSGLLISEVCIKTGFNDPKYFSKCFKQVYNVTPTEYSKKYSNTENTDLENP
ncbi:two-component regulator propeller domain-containing protein [Flavivirga abyssicola]|uniref:hybrid sensor histidine kinase/response regulator transcription factor n=1 Tax=Flavivirga abyssicola TaxID=3063533 RepID=UPI0026DF002B|nr:two-component regulator propeller domain-containing protein [Flavivirga sp. MEBiC07777]WVK11666.1 two-component regulator propeller domain-containing protein [Flavivirga sp. MEBiC07777]